MTEALSDALDAIDPELDVFVGIFRIIVSYVLSRTPLYSISCGSAP